MLFLSSLATARTPAIEGQLPQPQGFVSDFAGKLSSNGKQEIEVLLREFADRSGIDFAVVTVPFDTCNGQPIEEYSLALDGMGIGRGPEKLGLLLLIAIKPADSEGRYSGSTRLEVSRKLERDIPDELAAQTIRIMRDDFQAGRFDRATKIGVVRIINTLSEKRNTPR
jgi:uncharacterized membrane protein YgcG